VNRGSDDETDDETYDKVRGGFNEAAGIPNGTAGGSTPLSGTGSSKFGASSPGTGGWN
jgi:hypothetical protein